MSDRRHPKKPGTTGWVKLLREVPAISSLKKEEAKTKLPWKTIDDELIEETAEQLSSSDSGSSSGSSNGTTTSSSSRSGNISSDSSSSESSSNDSRSSDSRSSGSSSDSSSESNESTLSTHMSSEHASLGEPHSMNSLKESNEKDENEEGENDKGNDHSDDGDQSTTSLTVTDAVPQKSDWRKQYDQGNHESSAGIPDAGTIWGRVMGDTILSTSNESSLNYSDTSDITGFSMPYAANTTRPLHEEKENEINTRSDEDDDNDVNNEDECQTPSETPDIADALAGDERSESPDDAFVHAGETSIDDKPLRPLISTATQQNDELFSNPKATTAPTQKIDAAEEGGFLAFLAQMRQLTEQPVDEAIREFVPSDMAENARAAQPYNSEDDAETVQVKNEDQERKVNPRTRRNAEMSSNDAARGGSMDWRFSIPSYAQNSNHPLLGDHDNKKTPDFREIPLSYSPSARMQPWGPNADDLWTSTTRLLAAIPEEVASVISTASMSLSYIKIGQQAGNAGADPRWVREKRICLAIAIVATLIVTVIGLVFVVLAITNSNTTSLVASGAPMASLVVPTTSPSGPTRAPIASPVLRGSSLPSSQPSKSEPQTPIESQTPITSPSQLNIPSTPSFSPGPSQLANGPGIPGTTESPSTAPSTKYGSREPAYAPNDATTMTETPSILPSFDPTFHRERPSFTPSANAKSIQPGLAPGDGGLNTESPSTVPSFDSAFFHSKAPTFEQAPAELVSGSVSSIPSVNPTQVFSPGPLSLGPFPPSLPTVFDKLQPSSAPSVSSLFPSPVANSKPIATPVQFPTLIPPSVSPDMGIGYGSPTLLDPSVTLQPTLIPHDLTHEPTDIIMELPSVSPTVTFAGDVTNVPTGLSENSNEWELIGQIGNEDAYRSVKVSDAGNRAAIATSSQLYIFERGDDDKWQQLGDSIQVQGIHAISISGDGGTVAQGAFFDGNDSNKVIVYRWNGTAWLQMGSELLGSCAFPGSLELSRDGSIIAIGNPFQLFYAGYVEILEYDGVRCEWKRRGDIILGENAGDMAGASVSLSSDGSVVAFGSPGRTVDSQINIGQAAVFQYNPTFGWSQVGNSLPGFDPLKQFGYSISLSGNGTRVAISAPFADPQGDLKCTVYVYEATMSDQMWHPVGEGIDGLFLADNSGISISLASDGQTLAIGAPRRRYVRILVMRAEQGWTQIGFIESGNEQFGSSVSLASDGRVFIASGRNTFQGGLVQIFQRVEHVTSTMLR